MESKIIAISGATGFIAEHLINAFKEYKTILITREDFKGKSDILFEKIIKADVLINLAGEPIIKRWNKNNKQAIMNSRIDTTTKILKGIQLTGKNIHLLSASAIGIYNDKGIHNEQSCQYSEGFLYEVIENWEMLIRKTRLKNLKWTILRIGIVLAGNGGFYRRVKPIFKIGLGGKIGNGKQWMSFIHIDDLVNAVRFIIEKELDGIFNLTAPNPVTNKEFTQVIARIFKKPAIIPLPIMALKIVFGEGASVIYSGQNVIPERLITEGFKFKYPDIESTLKAISVD